MGTKVEGKIYLPGYFAMRDPNFSSNSSWSLYFEEKTSSGHPDDWFMSGSANGCSEYDKEMLKRTMLEHEAIFRKQVYELHRLYRIQKDLMQEFQKKELFRYPMSANTSNSNSFSSQMPCNGAKLNWQMPLFHTGYENSPITQKNEIKSSLNFLKEGSVQSSPNGITKKMFDLRLPADAYIDNEEEERSLKKNKSIRIDNGNDIKLTLGSVNGFNCRADSWVSDSLTQNNHNNQKMADLNQPFRETYCEGVADSASTDFLGMKKFSTENHLHHSSTRWNTGVLAFQRDLFKEKRVDEGSSSYFFDVNTKIRQENSFITRENGKGTGTMNNFFTHNCFTPEPQRSSEPADMKLKRNHETLLLDQNNAMDWFRPKTTNHPNVSRSALPSNLNSYHIHQESFGDQYLEGTRSENALPDGFRDGLTAQQDRTFCNLERRFEESAMAISWLRKKAACDEPVGLKKPQTVPSFLQGAAQEPNSKHENELVVSIRPDVNATSKPSWHIIGRDEASEDTSTRILGIPIYDKIQKSAIFLPFSCQEQSPNVDKDTEKASGRSGTTLRNLINLNDEYSEPLDVMPEIMVVNPLPTSVTSASVKSTLRLIWRHRYV
uniref:Uncharacterized protein n=1 Tax=Ananas comosus var. bracteatus TaxID=296719 RepID=A0A6V7NLI9_ANACO|nr:unnamed protein product [Ananas comosus var. bracteatus]